MKKLLLIAILMLALVVTAVACSDDKPADTTAGETTVEQASGTTAEPTPATTAEPAPETTVAPAPETTEAPAPETTEAPAPETTVAPETTGEPETEDPMAPVSMFDYKVVGNVINPGRDMQNGTISLEDGYVHVVPGGRDPFWFPFSCVDGARFVAIRYRTADATGANMQFFLASTGEKPSDDTSMLQQPITVDGEWHLAVFDTQSLIDAGVYDGAFVSYFRFDPLECGYMLDENGQPFKDEDDRWVKHELPKGCSIDVAYIGFFDSSEAAEKYDADNYPPAE